MTLSDYFALKSGNQASLVRILGVPQATVAQWASRNRSVPAEYCIEIEHATGGAVTRKELLPDTWASIWPELSYGSSIDEPLRARMIELAGEVAAAREQAAKDAADRKRHSDEMWDLRQHLNKAAVRNQELEQQVLTLFGPAATPADHGAKVKAAIAAARHVFEGERLAEDVLHYIEQMLAAAGGGNASIAEEGLTAAGAAPAPALEKDWRPAYVRLHATYLDLARRYDKLEALHDELKSAVAYARATAAVEIGPEIALPTFTVGDEAAARQAAMHQARADLAQAVDAPARPTAAQQAYISRHQAAIDRAAAAMAAESAQKVVDAERQAARAAGQVALEPAAVLSREVFSLSNKLQQPADITLQLLVLAEQRRTNEFLRTTKAGYR